MLDFHKLDWKFFFSPNSEKFRFYKFLVSIFIIIFTAWWNIFQFNFLKTSNFYFSNKIHKQQISIWCKTANPFNFWRSKFWFASICALPLPSTAIFWSLLKFSSVKVDKKLNSSLPQRNKMRSDDASPFPDNRFFSISNFATPTFEKFCHFESKRLSKLESGEEL